MSSRSNQDTQNQQNSDSFRFRQAARETFHRVVDKKEDGSSNERRIRQTVRDAYHKVVDKPLTSKSPLQQTPQKPYIVRPTASPQPSVYSNQPNRFDDELNAYEPPSYIEPSNKYSGQGKKKLVLNPSLFVSFF